MNSINPDENYTISECPYCNQETLIRHTFMIPDGHDDVDWDFDEWCDNKECPSNYKLKKEEPLSKDKENNMNVEKTDVTYQLTTNQYLAGVEFCKNSKSIFVSIKRNDEDEPQKITFYIDNSEQVSDLYDIFKKIYELNMGEEK